MFSVSIFSHGYVDTIDQTSLGSIVLKVWSLLFYNLREANEAVVHVLRVLPCEITD